MTIDEIAEKKNLEKEYYPLNKFIDISNPFGLTKKRKIISKTRFKSIWMGDFNYIDNTSEEEFIATPGVSNCACFALLFEKEGIISLAHVLPNQTVKSFYHSMLNQLFNSRLIDNDSEFGYFYERPANLYGQKNDEIDFIMGLTKQPSPIVPKYQILSIGSQVNRVGEYLIDSSYYFSRDNFQIVCSTRRSYSSIFEEDFIPTRSLGLPARLPFGKSFNILDFFRGNLS